MQPLHDILKKIVKTQGLEGGAAIRSIINHWNTLVGPGIAAHTCPDTIRSEVLTIIVDSPQWMHHLGFYKDEIINKLGQYAIKDVRFRHGRLPEKKVQKAEAPIDIELTDADRRYIKNTVKGIEDEVLKKKFETLIAHGLTRGRMRS